MRDVLEDYYAFTTNNVVYYCSECFAKKYFDGDIEALKITLENEAFITPKCITFNVIHENTVQFESFPHQIIPIQGIYCKSCGSELYAPDESDMRKQRFLFNSKEEQVLCQKYVEQHLIFDGLEMRTFENNTYELSFYTYEPLSMDEIEEIKEKFYCIDSACNEEI